MKISGNLHGAPVSFLLKEFGKWTVPLPGFEWINPVFQTSDIAYIGLRDVDKKEQEYLKMYFHYFILQKCYYSFHKNNQRAK